MAYQLHKARILVVDDMIPMLTLVKTVLGIFGFREVMTADNGEDAFELVCKHDPDIIITDWIMNPEDGLEFTKRIRRDPRTPNPYVPVVIMTGFSSKLRVESARDAGVTEFLVKPFTARDLYSRVVQIIEKPRQFVDSGEFFGPDRRRKILRDYKGPKRRERDYVEEEPKTELVNILKKLKEETKKL